MSQHTPSTQWPEGHSESRTHATNPPTTVGFAVGCAASNVPASLTTAPVSVVVLASIPGPVPVSRTLVSGTLVSGALVSGVLVSGAPASSVEPSQVPAIVLQVPVAQSVLLKQRGRQVVVEAHFSAPGQGLEASLTQVPSVPEQ